MTTLLRPLATWALWLDVLRQVMAGIGEQLERASFDVFVRIVIAAAGVALSSVLLIAIYPTLPADIQFFALVITGFVWYLSLAQIQPGRDLALLSYIAYLSAVVPTVLTLINIGVPEEYLPVLVERFTFTAFTIAFAMFVAIKLSIAVVNAIIWFFSEDWDNPELRPWERKALTIAMANLPDNATWRIAVPLAVQSFALIALGIVSFDLTQYIVGLFDYVLWLIALTTIQLGVYTLVGLSLYFDKDLDRIQMKRVPPPTFKQRLATYQPLSLEEASQIKRYAGWNEMAGVIIAIVFLIAVLLSFFLPATDTAKAYAFMITVCICFVLAFVVALYLHRWRNRIESELKEARNLS